MIRLGTNTNKLTSRKQHWKVTREELNSYIEEYFSRGGYITQLESTEDEAFQIFGSNGGIIGDPDIACTVKARFPTTSAPTYQTFQGRIL